MRWRRLDLLAPEEGPLSAIFSTADVVSEGGSRLEGLGRVYYGSTSVLLASRSRGGALPDQDVAALAALFQADPHLRVRALRIARREAETRAGGPLDTLRAEVTISISPAGVLILVDVVAPVRESAAPAAAR